MQEQSGREFASTRVAARTQDAALQERRLSIEISFKPLSSTPSMRPTPAGRALYALRKQTPEPVFGITKSAPGFRQFLLRGLDNARGEWRLVTMA
jgi:Transposase DDE domain